MHQEMRGLRKDSRGLDVTQLLIGSGGTLGVVTRAVIALTPLPHRTETWWLALDDPDQAPDQAADLFQQALDLDQKFAPAAIGLAQVLVARAQWGYVAPNIGY